MTEHTFEEVTIRKETIRLEHRNVPTEDVVLDEDNPRLLYLHQKEENKDKTSEDIIREMPDASRLRKDIEQNGGLRERVIVIPLANGKYKSAEGNRRRVAVGDLHAKNKSDPRWKSMPARVLPADFDPKKLAIMLAGWHVTDKVRWDPHEKAGHVYRMNKEFGIPLDEIATVLHASKTTVARIMKGYAFMMERFLTIDNGAYKELGGRKWSYFDELHRSKDLLARLAADPEFSDDFCRWVGEGRLAQPVQVRKLAKILAHPDARKVFEKTGASSAFAAAQRIVETAEPEEGSEFFKQLAKMKDNFRSAAQVREILRIRSDPIARKRLLETYEAMVDFMHLADVEVPSEEEQEAAA